MRPSARWNAGTPVCRVNILKNALEPARSRIELTRGVDRKGLGHRHPGTVTELLRALGDDEDGPLGKGLAEGVFKTVQRCSARYANVASTSQPAETDLGANRLSYGTFLAVTDERCAFRVSCGRASIASSPTRATQTMGSRRSTQRWATRHR
jgi:hypothetical protein